MAFLSGGMEYNGKLGSVHVMVHGGPLVLDTVIGGHTTGVVEGEGG